MSSLKNLILLCAGMLALSVIAPAHAATFTVTKTADTNDGTCNADCSLREAITVVNATAGADTINFDATVFAAPGPHVISLDTELSRLSSDVTIAGPGAGLLTVQATTQGAFTIFTVNSGVSATLSGLAIDNGKYGIQNDGRVTTANCTLSGNSASGIFNNSTLIATNCTLIGNSAGVYNNASGGKLTATNCTLSNNIYEGIRNSGTVTATNCTLSGNGIAFSSAISNSGTLTVTNCTLSGNEDDGIRNSGTLTATNCTLSGNRNDGIANGGTVTATNCTLSGNFNSGIYNGGTVTATNCTVSGNTGIFNYGTLTATNCTVSDNRNDGIYNSGTVTATNCTLSGNTNYSIRNNHGATVTATNCTFSGNGYGIRNNSGATVTATNCTVSDNTNYGIFNYGTVTLQNTLVAGNTTNVSGGFTNGGHNITSSAAAAGLDPAGLQDNGGPTKTIALLPGSPAIDAGNSTLTTDQRGFSRPSGSAPDIGAFEFGALPTLAVNNPRSVPEGSAASPGSITFDITLNASSTQTVTVNYQTLNGINNPAIAGSDYVEKHGKLTFAPGETLKRVTIFFIGDSVVEPHETFFLDLKTPTNASIADSQGIGTIHNDDVAALIFNNDEPSQ